MAPPVDSTTALNAPPASSAPPTSSAPPAPTAMQALHPSLALPSRPRALPKFTKVRGAPRPDPYQPERPLPARFVKKAAPKDVAVAVEWSNHSALLGFGTQYRPPDPQPSMQKPSYLGDDGLWAWNEVTRQPELLDRNSPYIAFVKIPSEDEVTTSLRYRRATRQDVAWDPEPEMEGMEGKKRKRGMGAVNGMFRVKDEVYEEMEIQHRAVREGVDRATRLLRRSAHSHMGSLSSTSIIRTIINDLREPYREMLDSTQSLHVLRYGCLGTYQDFDVCWTAHQRSCWILEAYIDFIGTLLPAGFSPALARLAASTPNASRRGVILAGQDVKPYIKFFRRTGIPVWVYVSLDEWDVPRSLFQPADPSRCSISECKELRTCSCAHYRASTNHYHRVLEAKGSTNTLVPASFTIVVRPRAHCARLSAAPR